MRPPAQRHVPGQDRGWLEGHPGLALTGMALMLATIVSPLWYATPDAAAYLSIARRLAHGAPPHAFGQPQPSFPLGYPVLISPAFTIADYPFVLLSAINWLLAIVFMLGTYRWLRRVAPDGAVLLTLLVMANVNVWNLYRRTLSEALFLPLLMWIVVLADGASGRDPGMRRGAQVAAIGILVVWLTATREIGLLAAIAVVATGLVARPRAEAAGMEGRARSGRERTTVTKSDTTARVPPRGGILLITATGTAAGALLVLRPERRAAAINALRAAFGDGNDTLAGVLGVFLVGVRRRIVEVGQLTIPGMFKAYADPPRWWDVNLAVGGAALAIIAVGWWRLARRRPDALLWMAPLYLVVICVWPYESGARYLLPLLPLLVVGGWEAWTPLGGLRRWLIALTVVAHLGVALGYWWWIDGPRAQACAAAWSDVEKSRIGLGHEPVPTGAGSWSSCARLVWQLALDRPLPPIEPGTRAGDDRAAP